jgi:hypothetical protein
MRLRTAITAAASIGFLTGALAEPVTDQNTLFSMLCVVEESTGFNWSGTSWTTTTFKPQNYIVSKLARATKPYCEESLWNERLKSEHVDARFGCYVLKDVGDERGIPRVCRELWVGGALRTIDCTIGGFESYRAMLDGPFVYTRMYAPLFLKDEKRKDSVVISIGKCSVLPH